MFSLDNNWAISQRWNKTLSIFNGLFCVTATSRRVSGSQSCEWNLRGWVRLYTAILKDRLGDSVYFFPILSILFRPFLKQHWRSQRVVSKRHPTTEIGAKLTPVSIVHTSVVQMTLHYALLIPMLLYYANSNNTCFVLIKKTKKKKVWKMGSLFAKIIFLSIISKLFDYYYYYFFFIS